MFGWLFRRLARSVSAQKGALAIGGDANNSSIKIGLDEVGVIGALQQHQLLMEIEQLFAEKERLERALNATHSGKEISDRFKHDPLLEIYGPEFLAKVARIGNPEREFELVQVLLLLCEKFKLLGGAGSLRQLIDAAEGVLRIYSREEAPYQWAAAKSHVGHSQMSLALGFEGNEIDIALFKTGAKAIAEAVECYDRDVWAEEFAGTSLSLAFALDCLAEIDPHNHPKSASVAVLNRALVACPPSSQIRMKLEEELRNRR